MVSRERSRANPGASLVPRLSPRANEKSKERGEPGRIYHVRNVIGRENLITCGRTNELAHAVRTEYTCDSFMADRMGLDGTIVIVILTLQQEEQKDIQYMHKIKLY